MAVRAAAAAAMAPTQPVREIVVLGGGISGLSLAYFLRQAVQQLPPAAQQLATRIRVVEASADIGGWVRTAQRDGFLFEEGPRGFRPSRNGAEMLRLVEQLGLEREMRTVDAAAKSRYILRDGHVEKLPTSIREVLAWPLTPAVAKAGLHELFAAPSTLEDESIYDFAARRFSPVVAERLLDPVASGIFGGDIRRLSVRSCFKLLHDLERESGSVVRGMLMGGGSSSDGALLDGSHKSDFVQQHETAMSVSFARGMSTLMRALESAIENDPLSELHTSTRVTSVTPLQHSHSPLSAAPKFTLELEHQATGSRESIAASHVFSTLPAFALAPVVAKSLPALAVALNEIEFVSMGMVHIGFDADVLATDGFGYLVPSTERERVLGVVFDSNAFPSQNTGSQTRLSVMCGGAHFPEIADLPLDAVEQLARDAVQRHLGITRKPDFVRAAVLANCIPQYHVGFWQTLARIEQQLAPGMHLGGNSFYGVGVADSVTRSKALALEYVKALA